MALVSIQRNDDGLEDLLKDFKNLKRPEERKGQIVEGKLLGKLCDADIYLPDLEALDEIYSKIGRSKEDAYKSEEIGIADYRVFYLNIFKSILKIVPESISNLSALRRLQLLGMQLSNLPESIGRLSSLQALNLSNNQLSSLPESIGNLSSLKELWLSWNRLSTLPENMGNLSSLKNLMIDGNEYLSAIPKSLENIRGLQSVYLLDCEKILGNVDSREVINRLEARGVRVYVRQEE